MSKKAPIKPKKSAAKKASVSAKKSLKSLPAKKTATAKKPAAKPSKAASAKAAPKAVSRKKATPVKKVSAQVKKTAPAKSAKPKAPAGKGSVKVVVKKQKSVPASKTAKKTVVKKTVKPAPAPVKKVPAKSVSKPATKAIVKPVLKTVAKPAAKTEVKASVKKIDKKVTVPVENLLPTDLPAHSDDNRIISVSDLAKPRAKKSTTMTDTKGKVRNMLVSQPFPENGKSPLLDIGQKYKIKVDYRSFIQVEGVDVKEFRRQRINLPEYTAIIFNSRNAIDYFFKMCEELRVKLSQDTKYFCVSEAIALYLQKYIQYRKRKVFYETPQKSLFDILNKHKDNEKFLYPCSKDRKDDIPNFLASKKFNYTEAYIYQTVPSNLSDLTSIKYDMIIFFSPVAIKSLFHNFPDFEQEDRRICTFGQVTHDAVKDAGLRLDIVAPTPSAPSMAQAIENYLRSIGMKSNG